MKRNPQSRRAGFTIIVVIALAVVATTLMATWTTQAVRNHRQVRQRHERAQADWLAYSGLARVAVILRDDAQYNGGTWRLEAEELQQADAAEIKITVDRNAAGNAVQLISRVRIPPGDSPRVQRTRTLRIEPAE